MSHKPKWMNQEENRAESLAKKETVANTDAPQLVRVQREPKRKQKAFYIQDSYAETFEQLVFDQKKIRGKKAPALAEEALQLLFDKYGVEI